MAFPEPHLTHTRWHKRLLVPSWTAQLLFQLFLFAIGMWNYVGGSFVAARVILLLLEILTLVLILHEILLFVRFLALGNSQSNAAQSPLFILTPVNFFVFQLTKACIWIVIFAAGAWLAFDSRIRKDMKKGFLTLIPLSDSDTNTSVLNMSAPYLGVVLHGLAVLLFMPTLIYATLRFRRYRQRRHTLKPSKRLSWYRNSPSPAAMLMEPLSATTCSVPFSPGLVGLSDTPEMECHPAFAPPELPDTSNSASPIIGGWRHRLRHKKMHQQPQEVYELSAVKTPASSKRSTRGFGMRYLLRHQRQGSKPADSWGWIDTENDTVVGSPVESRCSEELVQSPTSVYSPISDAVSPFTGHLPHTATFQPSEFVSPISERIGGFKF